MPILTCQNPNCKKVYFGRKDKRCKHNYCSSSCSVTVNNKLHPRNPGKIKLCVCCGEEFKSREKYCSRKCKDLGESISAKDLIDEIRNFVEKNGRIPFKQEFIHSHAARLRFGSWNKAVENAGYESNPVKFSKKYVANDGDKCDSLAEKIIDDYLFARSIKHIRNFPYPGDKKFTVDFKIRDYWVEFFGLSGQLKRYDELMTQKLEIASKHKLKLIKLYLRDIFSVNKLSKKLAFLR